MTSNWIRNTPEYRKIQTHPLMFIPQDTMEGLHVSLDVCGQVVWSQQCTHLLSIIEVREAHP